ncbi:MAG: hypothetical protein AAB367_04825 [Patescibacteria group bacterium]
MDAEILSYESSRSPDMFAQKVAVLLVVVSLSWGSPALAGRCPLDQSACARVVILDEGSPNLPIVQAVHAAYPDGAPESLQAQLAGHDGSLVMKLAGTEGAIAPTAEAIDKVRLRLLVEQVKAGTLRLPNAAMASTSTGSFVIDPTVAAVAADLDLEAGYYVVAIPGTRIGMGKIKVIPGATPEGHCEMPAVVQYPAINSGQSKSISVLTLNSLICEWSVATKKEWRKVRRQAKRRAEEKFPRFIFTGEEEVSHAGVAGVAKLADFTGCSPRLNECGGATNRFADLRSRIHNSWGRIATNVTAKSAWRWAGSNVACTNVLSYMYDLATFDGPGDLDIRWEPRDCDPRRGERCNSTCPLDWLVSTRAPNATFSMWNVSVGFHRFHYFIPCCEAGVQHDLYHFTRAEFLARPDTPWWRGIACGSGGNYGRGFPWYQFTSCGAYNG